ncbi:MAG: hypothetical protein J6A66_03400 [Alistipes sp.]|nr:hypothetical protein [Alistipes sp.]
MDNKDKATMVRNAIRIKILSQNSKQEPQHELMKLPIEALYKTALQEIGAQKAYIDEQNDTIKKLRCEIKTLRKFESAFNAASKEERMAIRQEEMYQVLRSQLKHLREDLKSMRESRGQLIVKLIATQNELEQLKTNIGVK